MFEAQSPERLGREVLVGLVRRSVDEAHKQNPNALGFVIHGSRANEGVRGKKQPRRDSDLDVIAIRRNHDNDVPEALASVLWGNIGSKYNINVDTGPWGSLEWEEVLRAIDSPADKEMLRSYWSKHLGEAPIIVGANPEIETAVKKALLD